MGAGAWATAAGAAGARRSSSLSSGLPEGLRAEPGVAAGDEGFVEAGADVVPGFGGPAVGLTPPEAVPVVEASFFLSPSFSRIFENMLMVHPFWREVKIHEWISRISCLHYMARVKLILLDSDEKKRSTLVLLSTHLQLALICLFIPWNIIIHQ